MAYGLNPQLFVENGPTIQAANALARSSAAAFRAWRSLSEDGRLQLVDMALSKPANDDDLVDGLPIAL